MANTIEIIIKQSGQGNAIHDANKALSGLSGAAGGAIGSLGKFGGALGNMATVAGGIVAANIFGKIAEGISSFVTTGLNAVGSSQQLETSLKSLLTANNMYEQSTETVTQAVTRQIMSQDEYGQKLDELNAKLVTQRATYQEQQERIRQLTEQYGENGLVVIKNKAQHEQLAIAIRGTEQDIAGLVTTETKLSTSTETAWHQVMSQSEAMKIAKKETASLLEFVSRLAVVSPFETEDVELTTKYAVAAGLGLDQTKAFVPAFLDLAASVGITSESLGFAADQLFQVRKIGKLTEIDLRQLRRLGIDLGKIIGVEMGMSVEEFNAKAATTPEIFDELFDAVTRFSANTFAGTSKEMALSVKGLQSTLSDVFVIGSRTFLRPLVDAFTPAIAGIVGKLSDFVLGGEMKSLGDDLVKTLMGGIATFQKSGAGGLFASLGFEGGALFFKKLSELMTMITGDAGTLAETIQGVLGGAFSWLATNLFPMLSQGIQFVMDHFEEFKGALMGIGGVLAVGALVGIAAAILSLLTPINLIIAGAALLGAAWAGNWGDIQGKTFAAWAVIQPVLAELMTWLQINIPVAVQFLSELWNTTLLPAMLAVAEFITGTYIPMWLNLYDWLFTNIPLAIQALSDFWTNTLLPAVTDFWNFGQNTMMPFWASLASLLTAVVGVAITALAGLWQNILKPALMVVIDLVARQLQPGFQAIAKIIEENVSPAANKLGGEILPMLSEGLETVVGWIKDATGYFNGLAQAVRNFTLPDVLTPGSPPPFAIALQDIANAANMAGAAVGGFSQATIDSLLGVTRGLASNVNAIGAARDDVEKYFDSAKLGGTKTAFALSVLSRVFRDNSEAILGATDRAAKFKELANSAINWEKAGFSGQPGKILQAGIGLWINAFDKRKAELLMAKQQMFVEAGKTALSIGMRLNDIVQGSIDVLDTRVETLQGLVSSGMAEVNFEGMIISQTQAQELLNAALAEQLDIQDDIFQLKQNEQKLGFLEKQLGLIDTLNEAGLNVKDILGGITLGLDASIPDMIAATNKLVMAMIEQVNKDLQLASPSKVLFKKFQLAGMGAVQGLMSMKPMLEKAIGPVIDPLMSAGNGGSVSNRTVNNYFSQTVNTRAESSTVIGDFRTMQMLLGA